MTSCSIPKRSHSATVWAKSRAVTRTSAPRARSPSMTGRSTSTCGLLVRSTQIRIAHGGHDLVDLVARERGRDRQGQVRARELVAERQLDAGAPSGHGGLAVDRRAVVAAGADAGALERGDEIVRARVADDVEVPRRAAAVARAREGDDL